MLSLTIGGMFAFYTPVVKSPDEVAHFLRAYQCSGGECYAHKLGDEAGGWLPVSLASTVIHFEGWWPWSNRAAFSRPLNKRVRDFQAFSNTAVYSPIPYVASALSMAIGRRLNWTPLLLFYLGRLGNVVAYALLASSAVRWMPIQRGLMFLLVLSPMSLFLAGTLSADVIMDGLSFLAIAMALYYAIEAERVSNRGLAGLVLVFSLVALSKQAYYPLVFLFFLIPPGKLGTRGRWALAAVAALGIPLLLDVAWFVSIRSIYVPLRPLVNPSAQLHFILEHPWDYVTMFWTCIAENDFSLHVHTIGLLGNLDVFVPGFVFVPYWIAILTMASLGADNGRFLNTASRWLLLAIHVMGLFSVVTHLYLSWDNVGSMHIMGPQPRHVLPFMPLLFLPFHGLGIAIFRPQFSRAAVRWLPWWGSILVLSIAVVSLWSMAGRYYCWPWHCCMG